MEPRNGRYARRTSRFRFSACFALDRGDMPVDRLSRRLVDREEDAARARLESGGEISSSISPDDPQSTSDPEPEPDPEPLDASESSTSSSS